MCGDWWKKNILYIVYCIHKKNIEREKTIVFLFF